MFFPVSVFGGLRVFVAGLVVGGTQPGSWGITGWSFLWRSQHAQLCLAVYVQLLKIVIWNPTASLWFLPLLNII